VKKNVAIAVPAKKWAEAMWKSKFKHDINCCSIYSCSIHINLDPSPSIFIPCNLWYMGHKNKKSRSKVSWFKNSQKRTNVFYRTQVYQCTSLKSDIYFRIFSEKPDTEQTKILSHMQNLVQLGKEQVLPKVIWQIKIDWSGQVWVGNVSSGTSSPG